MPLSFCGAQLNGLCSTLEEQLDKTQIALEEERTEKLVPLFIDCRSALVVCLTLNPLERRY